MLAKLHLPKLLFGGVLLIAVGMAAFGFANFAKNLESMRIANQENILWSSTQLEKELMRFRDSLSASERGATISSAEINLRFDVLWSRVTVFQRGKVGTRLRDYDSESQTIVGLFDELKKQEALVVSVSSYDFATMTKIHRAFYPYSEALSELSRRVQIGEELKATEFRTQMREGMDYALYASAATVLLVFGALAYFVREGRLYRKLADQNMILADRHKQASLVKSRFLTMMSHELRTPMNGVLGLLAVVRDSPMEEEQRDLLDQADRSANRMQGMLTDILEFAALENAQFAVDDRPFLSNELLSALPDLLGPVAKQAEARLHVAAMGELPTRLCGDATRLRRSYALMITYFLETAGARDIELQLSYENGHLLGRIIVDYLDGGWSADLIFGERGESEDSFASEVLGPSVARALVSKMGGEIRQLENESGKVELLIDVPVKAMEDRSLKVLLNMQSTPMEIICKSAIAGSLVDFICENQGENAEVVMMESGMADEPEKVAQMRKKFPAAQVFGIGRPRMPEIYDFVAEVPLEIAQLKNRVSEMLR